MATPDSDAVIHLVVANVSQFPIPLEQMRSRMPQWRQQKYSRLRRTINRQECALTWLLLEASWRMHAIRPLPATLLGQNGRPRFSGDTTADFNLSHRDGWCTAATTESEVGVDIHTRIPFDDELLGEWAGTRAPAWRGPLRDRNDLAPLWTRLEALGKATGNGLRLPNGRRGHEAERRFQVTTWHLPEHGVTLSLAAPARSPQQLAARAQLWGLEDAESFLSNGPLATHRLRTEAIPSPVQLLENHVPTH